MYERPQFEIASDGAHEVTSSGEEARIYVDVVNQPDLEDYIPIDVEVDWYGEHEDASWGYYGGDPGDSPMIDSVNAVGKNVEGWTVWPADILSGAAEYVKQSLLHMGPAEWNKITGDDLPEDASDAAQRAKDEAAIDRYEFNKY